MQLRIGSPAETAQTFRVKKISLKPQVWCLYKARNGVENVEKPQPQPSILPAVPSETIVASYAIGEPHIVAFRFLP